MPYILLIVGLLVVFFSVKGNFPVQNDAAPSNSFTELLDHQIKDRELKELQNQIRELTSRINNIEDSILLTQSFDGENSVSETNNTELISESGMIKDLKVDTITDSKLIKQNSLNSIIYELYDKGNDIENICSALGLGKGEVLLRLGLRKQQK